MELLQHCPIRTGIAIPIFITAKAILVLFILLFRPFLLIFLIPTMNGFKEEITSIRLMDILRQKKAPLNAHQEVLEWHLKDKGRIREHESLKDAPEYKTRSTLMKKLIPRYNLEAMMPKIKRVRLPSSKAVVKIPYRDAKDCIVSLLTDPRFDPKDYLFTNKNPFAPPPDQVTAQPSATLGLAS